MNDQPLLRALRPADCPLIHRAFAAQGWKKPVAQYRRYLREQTAGTRDVIVAEVGGTFAGYLTVVWESAYPPFRAAGIPEIVDFNVLKRYQRCGLGTRLMDAAEDRIRARAAFAGIGVGVYADYGPAQILYVRRGYVPDGSGLTRNGSPLEFGDRVTIDDGVVLHLTKRL